MIYQSELKSDNLTHHERINNRHVFENTNMVNTVYNARNMNWHSIHDSVTIDKSRDLFDTELLVQGNENDKIDISMVHINVNKNCMT